MNERTTIEVDAIVQSNISTECTNNVCEMCSIELVYNSRKFTTYSLWSAAYRTAI